MTVYTVTHKDSNTVSVRESDKDLMFAVVVKTPVELRHQIQNLIDEVDYLTLDQIDRALSDGSVTEWGGVQYIGGVPAPSVASLQKSYDDLTAHVRAMRVQRENLVDLYQVVGWFEDLPDAQGLAKSLRDQYVDDGWPREVYVDFTMVDEPEYVPF